MRSEIENKGKSKEKIRFGKGLPKWLSHRSTEVYRNSDPAEVPNRTEDFGRPLATTQEEVNFDTRPAFLLHQKIVFDDCLKLESGFPVWKELDF